MKTNTLFLTLALCLLGVSLVSGLAVADHKESHITPYGDNVENFSKDEIVTIMERGSDNVSERNATLVAYWVQYHGIDSFNESEAQLYNEFAAGDISNILFGSDEEQQIDQDSLNESNDSTSGSDANESSENESSNASNERFPIEEHMTVSNPSYVDSSPHLSVDNGTLLVKTAGPKHRFYFNDSVEIVDFSVVEDAQFSYDARSNSYVLKGVQNGTYTLNLEVRHNNSTRDVQMFVQVSDPNYEHLPQENYEELLDKALAWEGVQSAYSDYCEGREDCEELVTGAVLTWYDFQQSPFKTLQEQAFALGMMLVATPIGQIAVGGGLIWYLVRTFRLRKENQEAKRKMGVAGDIETGKMERQRDTMNRMLAEKDYQDLGYNDRDAAFLRRQFGDNPYSGVTQLLDVMSLNEVMTAFADIYEQNGYVAVETDESYDIVPEEEAGDEFILPTELAKDDLGEIDWQSVDKDVNFAESGVTLPMGVTDKLVDEFDVKTKEDGYTYALLDSRSEFAGLVAGLFNKVAALDEVDEDGYLREEYAVLNFLWMYIAEASERYNMPIWAVRDVFLSSSEQYDTENSLSNAIDDLQQYGEL